MDSKGEHLEFVSHRGQFTVDCSHEIFSPEELCILEKWGHWFRGLTDGDLKPFTEVQEQFIQETAVRKKTGTIYEIAWRKYLFRKKLEREKGEKLNIKYEAEHDTFYSREDRDKLMRINFSTMGKNHTKGLNEK